MHRLSTHATRQVLLAAGMLAACQSGAGLQVQVDRWLTCYECSDGELDSLHAIAKLSRPQLREVLVDRLRQGPSASFRAALQTRFGHSYDLIHPPPGGNPADRDLYIRRYLDRVVASYRLRAAQALVRTGGADSVIIAVANGQVPVPNDTIGTRLSGLMLMMRDSLAPWPP